MAYYTIRMLSFQFHPDQGEAIRSILACPSVSDLLFPAILPRREDEIHLKNAQQFELSMIPEELTNERFVTLNLAGASGIQFSTNIHVIKTVTADVVNLWFKTEDLKAGTISRSKLSSLMEEIIPIFDVTHGSIYDADTSKREGRPKGFPQTLYPYGIDWMTYFGPEVVDYFGQERFEGLKSCSEKYDINGGIMVILQDEPFRVDNPEHIERQEKAEAELRLDELVGIR